MNRIVLKTSCGEMVQDIIDRALAVAHQYQHEVHVELNGIWVIVNIDSERDDVYTYYCNELLEII